MKFLFTLGICFLSNFLTAQNVGIGTTTPQYPLSIKAEGIGLSQESLNGNTKAGFYVIDGFSWVQTHTKTNLNFTTNNGNTKMMLDTSGNVGIGDFDGLTTAARLHVMGNFSMNNSIYVSNPSTTNGTPLTGPSGLFAEMTATNGGGFATAIRGINRSTNGNGYGLLGYHAGSGTGVSGESPGGYGVYGATNTGAGGYFKTWTSGSALYTEGKITHTGIGEGAGKVLTSDAAGVATWQTPPPFKTGFKVYTGSALSVGNSFTGTVPFTTTAVFSGGFDDGNNFDNATNSYIAPVSGFYSFDVMVGFQSRTATSAGILSVYGIGTSANSSNLGRYNLRMNVGDILPEAIMFSFKTKMDAGDKMSVALFHTIGGNVVLNSFCHFTGVRLY